MLVKLRIYKTDALAYTTDNALNEHKYLAIFAKTSWTASVKSSYFYWPRETY